MNYSCDICGDLYDDEWLVIAHKELYHSDVNSSSSCKDGKEEGEEEGKEEDARKEEENEDEDDEDIEVIDALEGAAVRNVQIKNKKKKKLEVFLSKSKDLAIEVLRNELTRLNVLKFNLVLHSIFSNEQDETSERGFITRNRSIVQCSDLEESIEECLQELILKITEHEARGSGWSLLEVVSITIRSNKQGYGDRGGSYLPLPEKIAKTKSCLNVKNADNECFRYAMLVKFLSGDNVNRPSKRYQDVSNKYNFTKITYPVSLKDVNVFEKNNPGVSVNVYGLDGQNNIYPLKVVKSELRDHTDLLLLQKDGLSHYVYIKNFYSLLSRQLTKHAHSITVCKRCLSFVNKSFKRGGSRWLFEHSRMCDRHEHVKITLPTPGNNYLFFNKVNHQYRIPIVVYADFEATLIPMEENMSDTRRKYQKHEPNSYCILVKSELSDEQLEHYGLSPVPTIYRGENAAKSFIDALYDIAAKVEVLYSYIVPMEDLNESMNRKYESSSTCYLCREAFTDNNKKVRDHDHLTGFFRGAACNNCNINYKLPNFIPVVIHNLSRYDSHFIIPELGRDEGEIDVLATTNENFISFSKKVGKIKLRFLDSYRFTPHSIATLTKNLQEQDFTETKKIVPNDKLQLVLRKGVFCYDYIDSLERFNETSLPPIEKFYSKLNDEELKVNEYEHALAVWDALDIKTLGDYSDFYVKLDVTLLCDIMEEFRTTCFSAYGLDPFHSYTAPGLAWQAMMKETKCKLELLTDIDMLLMIESGVRGGLTQSVTRNVKANHKYLKDYNPNQESIYLGYFDANNLYGWAMSNPLPDGGFEWVNPENIDYEDILNIPQHGDTGYFFDCDVEYPETIHDHHYDLPFLPKSEIPPGRKHQKLMSTLENKYRYVAHFWTIQQAVKHGLKVKKIHRVLKFSQSCWLKPYIDSNTKRRAAAQSSSQQKFFKDMNNSIFGKQLEDKRKHKNVKLVTSAKKLEKLVAKPNFETSIVINEKLVAVCMKKTAVKMDRPIYSGMSILDISKTLMYDFHYSKMVDYYGRNNIGICYMDTDAFVYWMKTDDMYKDLRQFPHKNDFDFSDYSREHPTYDNGVNKKIIGKFKDELKGNPIKEIISLAAKMYALEVVSSTNEDKEQFEYIKKAKGIKSLYVKKKIKFDHYKESLLLEKTYSATYNVIRSFNHRIYSITETKKSLSPNDDKRVILEDRIHTLPYGHYSLIPIDD